MAKNHRKGGKRGYRLHDERIAYSGGTGSMRSIKYELQGADKQTIIDAVIHDNKRLYGDLNLNDYLAGEKTANFMDFWILSLSLGFVFSKQSHAVFDFTTDTEIRDELFGRIDQVDKAKITKESWLNFYKACKDGKTGINVFEKDNRKDVDVLELVQKYNNLKEDYNRAEARIKLFISDYQEKSEDDFPKYQNRNVAWHCYPDFEIEVANKTDVLDEIIAHYNRKFGISENKKDD